MKLVEVSEWTYFQRLILLLSKELHRRGYDVHGANTERVTRIACTHPPVRALLNKCGYEWVFPPEEKERLAALVRANLSFMEFRTYYCGEFVFVLDVHCEHGNQIHCEQCWYKLHPEERNYATNPE